MNTFMQEPEAISVAMDITEHLSRLGVAYYIVGSFATSLYGFWHECQDLDIVADIREHHVASLTAALQAKYSIAEGAVYEAVEKRTFFPLMSWDISFKADIFVIKNEAWAQNELARRRLVTIDPELGRVAYVASPEDILIERFLRYQAGGIVYDQHWQDVLGIVTLQASRLDFAYIAATTHSLGIFADWQRVWRIMDQDSYQASPSD